MGDLIYGITEYANFISGFNKVASGGGTPGTDHISAEQFGYSLERNIQLLIEEIKTSSYSPRPIAKFQHKEHFSDKVRVLGIPCVRDRIVQVAVINVLEPIFEKQFLRCSYGYRPRKSAMQAVIKSEKFCADKTISYVFNADIHSFFDSIDAEILLERIKAVVKEKPLASLLSIIIKNSSEGRPKGITLGAPTSPLFGNIYLNDFDKLMFRESNSKYLRYADDFVLFSESKDRANGLKDTAVNFLEKELMLVLSEKKSTLADIKEVGFDFLGYHFNKEGKYPSEKALGNFSEKITDLTMNGAKNIYLDSIIEGWMNYFDIKISNENNYREIVEKIDGLLTEKPEFNVGLSILKGALMAKNFQKDISSFIIKSIKDKILSNEASGQYSRDVNLDAAILSNELDMGKDSFDFIAGDAETGIENIYGSAEIDVKKGDRILKVCDYFNLKGDYEKSIRLLNRFIERNPDFSAGYEKLSEIYEKLGLAGMAGKMKELYPAKTSFADNAKGGDDAYSIPNGVNAHGGIINKKNDGEIGEITPVFLNLFAGANNAYAEALFDRYGKLYYSKLEKPLNEEAVMSHIGGLKTIGEYIMRPDNCITYTVLDIDISSEYIKNIPLSSNDYSDFLGEAFNYALLVKESVKNKTGCDCYIEFSGYKGYHVWFFFDKPVPAKSGRKFAGYFVDIHKVRPHINVEIFPKENKLSAGSHGSLIKLPLGINKSTGNETYFVDDSGNKIMNQFKFLIGDVIKIPDDKIKKIINISPQSNQVEHDDVKLNGHESMELALLLEKCPVLRYLYDKAKITKYLTHTERLSILYSIGHIADGKDIVHNIMRQCSNYDKHTTQKYINKMKGKQYQISCFKLREWLSYITSQVDCNCKFNLEKNEYPNILLHLKILDSVNNNAAAINHNKPDMPADVVIDISGEEKNGTMCAYEQKIDGINEVFLNFLIKKRELSETIKALKEAENEIDKIFNEYKSDKIETPWGIYRKIKQDGDGKDGKSKFIIEI